MFKLWWEMTRARVSWHGGFCGCPGAPQNSPRAVWTLAAICSIAIGLNIALSVDFSGRPPGFVLLEIVRRLLSFGFLFGRTGMGRAWSSYASPKISKPKWFELDERPAPVDAVRNDHRAGRNFSCTNLIEFSFYETGPLFLFALLAGRCRGHSPKCKTHRKKEAPAPNRPMAIHFVQRRNARLVSPWAIGVFRAHRAGRKARLTNADDSGNAQAISARAADLMRGTRFVKVSVQCRLRDASGDLSDAGRTRAAPPVGRAQLEDAPRRCSMRPIGNRSIVDARSSRARRRSRSAHHSMKLKAARRDYRQALQLDPANIRLRVEYAMKTSRGFSPLDTKLIWPAKAVAELFSGQAAQTSSIIG